MTSFSTRCQAFWNRYRCEYAELTKLGFPVMLTQLGVIAMSFADTLMLGSYSVEALASSAFVNSVFLIPLVMLSGLSNGITPLVGALFTRNKLAEAGRITRAGLQINTLVALVFMALMGVLYFFLDIFRQPEELMPYIREYYLTMLGTLLPMAWFNSFSQTCNGVTDTRTPMWCIIAAIGGNIIGNWLLIFGHCGCPRLGLLGAGIATVASRFIGLIAIIIIYMKSERYSEQRTGCRTAGRLGVERLKVWITSYPVMIQSGVECALWSLGAVTCGWFGKIQLAAYQIVNTIGQLGFMTYMSFGVAVSVRVANYTGLHDSGGVGNATWAGIHLNIVLATIASALMWIFAHPLLELFTSDSEVVAAGVLFIIPLVLYQYFDASQLTFINAIRGTSKVKPLLWISIISYVAVGTPLMMLFAVGFNWESIGVYYSFDAALLTATLLGAYFFKHYHSMRNK